MPTLPQKLKRKGYTAALGEPTDTAPTTGGTFTATSRTKVRRRPAFLALGIALVVVFALGAVYLVNGLRDTRTVLVAAGDISQGQQIERGDLTTATVNADSGLTAVPSDQIDTITGTSAAVTIPAGTVINPNAVTDTLVPPPGQTLVGITATYNKLPATTLQPGDYVRIVDTPRDQDDPPVQGPITSNAQVVGTRDIAETGQVTVDVLVPAAEAMWVSARAATGRLAIILDGANLVQERPSNGGR